MHGNLYLSSMLPFLVDCVQSDPIYNQSHSSSALLQSADYLNVIEAWASTTFHRPALNSCMQIRVFIIVIVNATYVKH